VMLVMACSADVSADDARDALVDAAPLGGHEPTCNSSSSFRGLVHAVCSECTDPSLELRCKLDAPGTCLWVSVCDQNLYVARYAEPEWGMESNVGYTRYWGIEPWSRDRGMALTLNEGPVEGDGAQVGCECELESPPANWADADCIGAHGICGEDSEKAYQLILREGWTPERGSLAWVMTPVMASVGFSVVLELDVERMRARACLIGQHDAYQPRPDPQCASAGTVSVSSTPIDAASAERVGVVFRAEFDPVAFSIGDEPFIHGLVISGSIANGAASVVHTTFP
jgi:hypothetical protein